MRHLATLAIASALSACSPAPQDAKTASPAVEAPASQPPTPAPVATSSRVLGLEGLGDLRIGQAPPTTGAWAEHGAQMNEACRTLSSPDYPGVYAMVTGGKVRRISVREGSDVKLAEGVGVGAPEADVMKWFAGFRAEPHKYEAAPAKYLTAPNAASGDSALRFEIGADGKVKMIHIGTMPELAYVEGCA
jgi:hypothetical protein